MEEGQEREQKGVRKAKAVGICRRQERGEGIRERKKKRKINRKRKKLRGRKENERKK